MKKYIMLIMIFVVIVVAFTMLANKNGSSDLFLANANSNILSLSDSGKICDAASENENGKIRIGIYGDINKDGKITSLDYIAIRNHMMNKNIISSTDIEFKAADMNNDNKIGSLDYIAVRKIMMNES